MTQTLVGIRNFMGGEFVEPISGRYLDNVEPATGKSYSQVADSDARDVDLAAAAAEKEPFVIGQKKRQPNDRTFCYELPR